MYRQEVRNFEGWRAAARPLLASAVAPREVVWSDWREPSLTDDPGSAGVLMHSADRAPCVSDAEEDPAGHQADASRLLCSGRGDPVECRRGVSATALGPVAAPATWAASNDGGVGDLAARPSGALTTAFGA